MNRTSDQRFRKPRFSPLNYGAALRAGIEPAYARVEIWSPSTRPPEQIVAISCLIARPAGTRTSCRELPPTLILEVQAGVDPAHNGFADRRVPVSPLHHLPVVLMRLLTERPHGRIGVDNALHHLALDRRSTSTSRPPMIDDVPPRRPRTHPREVMFFEPSVTSTARIPTLRTSAGFVSLEVCHLT